MLHVSVILCVIFGSSTERICCLDSYSMADPPPRPPRRFDLRPFRDFGRPSYADLGPVPIPPTCPPAPQPFFRGPQAGTPNLTVALQRSGVDSLMHKRLPISVSKGALVKHILPKPPPILRTPWWVNLKNGLKTRIDVSSIDVAVRAAVVLLTNPSPEFASPHPIVKRDLGIAARWEMRYDEDNVKMTTFQISSLVTMVMGLPMLVAFVNPQPHIPKKQNTWTA